MQNKNVIFIDSNVRDYETIVNSVNSITLPIVYTLNTSKTEVLNTLRNNFINIQNIAVCSYSQSMFLDGESFFTDANTEFIINVIKEFYVENIHYLACNSLKDPKWVDYFNIIKNATNIVVGASNDLTGNLMYGGNWDMENISTNIEQIYFLESIQIYKYLLGQGNYTVIIKDGKVYGCGWNHRANLGDFITTTRNVFKLISLPPGKIAQSVSTGYAHTLVATTDGTGYSCGVNWYGQLGNGTYENSYIIPMILPEGKRIQSVSAGEYHTLALMRDGTVYACGWNSSGELGDGTKTNKNILTPMILPEGKIAVNIAVGSFHSVVVTADGTAYACGTNWAGQLGYQNPNGNRFILEPIILPQGKIAQSACAGGYHTILVMTDETVYACGLNSYGQLGNGTYAGGYVLAPMIIPSGKKVKSVSAGETFTVVIMTDNTAYACGRGNYGQLGNGITDIGSTILTPMILPSGKKVLSASTGYYHTTSIMTDNTVYACGSNSYGELGDGTKTNRNILTRSYIITSDILTMYNEGVPFSLMLSSEITLSQIINAGITLSQLVAGGITISQLVAGGITISQLVAGGITIGQIVAGGITIEQLIASGITIEQLIASGYILSPKLKNFPNLIKTYAQPSFNLNAPESLSLGLITYSSSDSTIASVSGSMVTMHKAGIVTITAAQAENNNYISGTITCILEIKKANPKIIDTYYDTSRSIHNFLIRSNSDSIFSYTFSDSTAVTINSDNTLSFVKPGDVLITAKQEESQNFYSGTFASIVSYNG